MVSGIILATIITLLMWVFRETLINALYRSATELVKQYAKQYIEITLLTYPFIAIEQISVGILRGSGDTKTPMYITIFMNIINLMLGFVLIIGLDVDIFGISIHTTSFGIIGAASAIAIARLIGTGMILFVLIRGTTYIKLRKVFPFKFNSKVQKSIFNIGVPAGVEQVLFNMGKFIVQIFIVTMGTTAIASNTIALSIASMVNVLGNSFALAAMTLVGQYVGRGDIKGGKNTLIYLAKFATVCILILSVVMFPIAPLLARLYTDSSEVITLSALLIRADGVAMIIWPISFVFSAGLKGAGDTRYTMVTASIGMWVFRVFLGYILGVILNFGVLGVWIGMFSDWFVRGILYSLRLRGDKWIKHRIQ